MVELFNNLHNVNATFSLFYILRTHRHTSHTMDVLHSSPGDSSRIKFHPGLNETDPGVKFLSRNHSLYFTRILIFGQAENSAQPENFPYNNPVSNFRSNGLNYLLAGNSIEVKFGLKFRDCTKELLYESIAGSDLMFHFLPHILFRISVYL